MSMISTSQLDEMKRIAIASFSDTCSIAHRTVAADSYGDNTYTTTSTDSNVACGFKYSRMKLGTADEGIVLLSSDSAELRLALTQSIGIHDLVTVNSVVFQLNGYPQKGRTVQIVNLVRYQV